MPLFIILNFLIAAEGKGGKKRRELLGRSRVEQEKSYKEKEGRERF